MHTVYWIGGAFLLGLGSGVVGTVLVWRKNAATLTADAQKVQSAADAIKKL